MNKAISVVFFGAGPVAAESLQNIAKLFDVEMVITKKKPKICYNRGYH